MVLLLLAASVEATPPVYVLIAPPVGESSVNLAAPISAWERLGTFDLNADCFAPLAGYRNASRKRVQGSNLGPEARYQAALLELSATKWLLLEVNRDKISLEHL